MQLEQEHIDHIQQQFATMSTKDEFVEILNYAKKILFGVKAKPFELKQITFYANPKIAGKRYYDFEIRKKSGGIRKIHAPVKGLKLIQKCLNIILQCVFTPHKAATGFIPQKSIVDNAKVHVSRNYVYNIDLKDFFPSIDQARVWKCLQLPPFNLRISSSDVNAELEKKYAVCKVLSVTNWYKNNINGNESNFPKVLKCGAIKVLVPLSMKQKFYNFYNIDESTSQNEVENIISKKESYIYASRSNIKSVFVLTEISASRENLITIVNDLEIVKCEIEHNKIILKGLEILLSGQLGRPTDEYETCKNYLIFLSSFRADKQDKKPNWEDNLSNIITALCCTEMEVERWDSDKKLWNLEKRNVLPQGAPTSPIITNIVCQKLDFLLSGVAKRFGLRYTRYADDITFSSQHNVFQKDGVFVTELRRIIVQQKFHIKEPKVRLQAAGYRQEVTGLVVNNNVNVHRKYIKLLRMWLYNWERYGYDRAYSYFLPTYLANKTMPIKGKPDMANVIAGKLEYLKMVRGKDDPCYLKLKDRLDKLVPSLVVSADLSITRILDIWENDGIDKAMEVFYQENIQRDANVDMDTGVLGDVL